MRAVIAKKAPRRVVLGTDKPVYPINVMGISRAVLEKVNDCKSGVTSPRIRYFATRCGNVMDARRFVIPLFLRQLLDGIVLTVTDRNMTRFLIFLKNRWILFFTRSSVSTPTSPSDEMSAGAAAIIAN
jgi:UDP-glucose 4-epimerase